MSNDKSGSVFVNGDEENDLSFENVALQTTDQGPACPKCEGTSYAFRVMRNDEAAARCAGCHATRLVRVKNGDSSIEALVKGLTELYEQDAKDVDELESLKKLDWP